MESQSSKPLTKDETKALLLLIEESNIIIRNKKMNAATNQMKVQEWIRIAQKFNNTISTRERTPRQLRLKWENLKKSVRKRNATIQMNSMTGGIPEYIRPDEVLDRVSSMLNCTINDYSDKFRGDSELNNDACSSPDYYFKHHTIYL
ncbi:PREDICTED: uncharacterized protein LOC106114632 [Papilio xuthus]|uniref:Regulatory protein zeste n=1 Tax=Papilio xuthus TaxID=66420 RepID=A0AAJ7E5E6_PAPXU|nr:PREDICTED: uncharacterized protein LOC106114632 [Papilio xuthus]